MATPSPWARKRAGDHLESVDADFGFTFGVAALLAGALRAISDPEQVLVQLHRRED